MNPEKTIKTTGYQIFLLTCPANFPFSFAIHPWFVCVKNGKISRWEVRFELNRNSSIGRHLHLNSFPPFSGIDVFAFFPGNFFWPVKLLARIEGEEGSLAQKIYDYLSLSPQNYSLKDKYLIWGPNSNTFVQSVLNMFPELKVRLPWNCFGKNYIHNP